MPLSVRGLTVVAGLLIPVRAPASTVVLMSGPGCPDAALALEIRRALGPLSLGDTAVVSGALARVRARRALARARRLYTSTAFSECAALLSGVRGDLRARAPRDRALLARTNLWLGACQWADLRLTEATESFGRVSRLGGIPPDVSLFPPELVQAYHRASSAPSPGPGSPGSRPAAVRQKGFACARPGEASDAGFVEQVTSEASGDRSIVVATTRTQIVVRLLRSGERTFRQTITMRAGTESDRVAAIRRALGLLLDEKATTRSTPGGSSWSSWWVWALAGAIVAGVTAVVIVSTPTTHVTEYRMEVGR
jgi:hypothetical protein